MPTEYDIYTRIPEEMGVGELNKVVRILREEIYQHKLNIQEAVELCERRIKKDRTQ